MVKLKTICSLMLFSLSQMIWAQLSFEENLTLKSSRLTIQLNTPVNGNLDKLQFGAFVERTDTLLCIGSIEAPEGAANEVSSFIYWEDGFSNEGFRPGEEIFYYVIDLDNNCMVKLIPNYFGVRPEGIQSDNEEMIITNFEINYGEFNYSINSTCRTSNLNITPEVNNIPDFFEIGFVSTQGIADPTTGTINPNASDTGSYIISAVLLNENQNYCWDQSSITFRLWDSEPIENNLVDYITEDQHCEKLGAITLTSNTFIDGYQELYANGENKVITSSGAEIELGTGFYEVSLLDSNNCILTLEDEIEIRNAGNCDDGYFLSAEVGQPDYIEFIQTGEIIIRDRSGQVIKNLQGPTSWNGVDDFGKHISFGLYYIEFEDGNVAQLKSYQ